MYFERGEHHKKKTSGNINIVQLGSNQTDYTVILELYNFVDNTFHLAAIGQKLRAIFNLDVDSITGCNHKADYSRLRKQYPDFNLPDKEIYSKMEDVAMMALNRGVVKRGRGNMTLQALCKGQGMLLKKPQHVRVGTCFASRNGSLSKDAQIYCQLDVETVLALHKIYSDFPDLTKRLTPNTIPPVGSLVDIMPECGSSIYPLAQGTIRQIGSGTWLSNGIRLTKKQIVITVRTVFNTKGVIHYPCDEKRKKICSCGRGSHGKIHDKCDFYLYSQLGKPPFQVMELLSHVRLYNEQVVYPPCYYDTEEAENREVEVLTNFMHGTNTVEIDLPEQEEDTVIGSLQSDDDDYTVNSTDSSDNDLGINPQALELLDEDTGYETTIASDDDDDLDEDTNMQEQPTPSEIRMGTDSEFNATLKQLIEEADKLSEVSGQDSTIDPDNVDLLTVEDIAEVTSSRTVLGDLFHFMDRAKLPMHHEYKALFFRSLRAAVFIMVKSDVEEVKEVLKSKPGHSWEYKMAFDFQYIAKRVRRRVPPPTILYNIIKAVFEFFKDKKDTKTGVILFHDKNKKKFNNMLEMVKKGYASDPVNIAMYIAKTNRHGIPLVDKDGLTLYRSIRGTSNLESLHQYLTTSFGHTIAGPWYSDVLLRVVRHFYNWRMSLKNRPHFPNLTHYNGLLIDLINTSYELIFGYSKYRDWSSFNENLPLQSVYGIVPVESRRSANIIKLGEADKQKIKQSPMLEYLSKRQDSIVPFLPIRGVKERKLIHRKLNELIARDHSLENHSIYEMLSKNWNMNDVSIQNKIYPKLPCHFAKYVKAWQKNQDRRDAEIASGANHLARALEYVPESQEQPTFEPTPLSQNPNPPQTDQTTTTFEDTGHDDPPPMSMELICGVCGNEPELRERPAKKRTRMCRNVVNGETCPHPSTCRGKNNRDNCFLNNKGDLTKLKKRVVRKQYRRSCMICGRKDPLCPGIRNRKKCKFRNQI